MLPSFWIMCWHGWRQRFVGKLDVGSHTLFTAEVVDADVLADGKPMTYAYYHFVKRGAPPKPLQSAWRAKP